MKSIYTTPVNSRELAHRYFMLTEKDMIRVAKGHKDKIQSKMVYEDLDGATWYIKTAYKHVDKYYVTACVVDAEEKTHELVDETDDLHEGMC
jgi:hypothetical protein